MAGLLDQISGLGTLMNADALKAKEESERQETYVKYAGYSLDSRDHCSGNCATDGQER